MKIKPFRVLYLFILTIHFSLSLSFASEHENVDSYTQFDLLEELAYGIPKIVSEKDEESFLSMEAKLKLHFDSMKELIEKQEDPTIARYGVIRTFRAMSKLGFSKKLTPLAPEYFDKYFSTCSYFIDCFLLVQDYSELVEIAPHTILKKIPELETIIENLDCEDSTKIKKLLLYYLRSSEVWALFYDLSGLHKESRKGKSPTLRNRLKLVRLWNDANDLYHSIYNDDSFMSNVKIAVDEMSGGMALSAEDEEFLFSFAQEMFSVAEQAKLGLKVLEYYDERILAGSYENWKRILHRKNRRGELDKEVLFNTLAKFVDYESYLPSRDMWVSRIVKLAKELGRKEFAPVSEAAITLLNLRNSQIRKYLESQKMFENQNKVEKYIGNILINNEVELANKFSHFHSLFYQISRMTSYQNELATRVASYEVVKKNNRAKGIKPDYENPNPSLFSEQGQLSLLEYAYKNVTSSWVTTACYAYYLNDTKQFRKSTYNPYNFGATTYQKKRYKVEIPGVVESYDLSSICHKKHKNETIAALANKKGPFLDIKYKVSKRIRWKKAMPHLVGYGFEVLNIAVIVFSGGAASAVSTPVKAVVKRYAVKKLAKTMMKTMTKKILAGSLATAASIITGATVFTVTQRALLSAITFNKIPIYEKDKSFYENYGKDLLVGGAIFFFLPYTHMIGNALAKQVTIRSSLLKSSPRLSKIFGQGVGISVDTSFFTVLPYVERSIAHLKGSKEPIYDGAENLSENFLHSLAISVAFRLRYRRYASKLRAAFITK